MSHRANRKTVKKLIQVRTDVEHEVPSSEDSDDDAVVPPTTPPRVKRLSNDSKVNTSQLSSVAFQTPTVVHSPTLTETPKRIKKSSPPKHELPVFALPSAAVGDEVSESESSTSSAPPAVYEQQPPPPSLDEQQPPPPAVDSQQPPPPALDEQQPAPPAVAAIVGATLVKAVATAAVVAVVASERQKLDDFVRNFVYLMAGTVKKIWMRNAHPPHSVEVFSTYGYTCNGQLAECTVFGSKASMFERLFGYIAYINLLDDTVY